MRAKPKERKVQLYAFVWVLAASVEPVALSLEFAFGHNHSIDTYANPPPRALTKIQVPVLSAVLSWSCRAGQIWHVT